MKKERIYGRNRINNSDSAAKLDNLFKTSETLLLGART